jgi:small subunit ribosomal protein S9
MAEIKADNPASKKTSQTTAVPAEEPKVVGKTADKAGFVWGVGRRKTSVARVRIRPGEGKLLINDRELNAYFAREQDRSAVVAPLKAVGGEKTFDVFVNVRGGGPTGQAGATLLGVARALKSYDESFLQVLRDGGYLTRDSRMVERKKPGKAGARRRFQFSKR